MYVYEMFYFFCKNRYKWVKSSHYIRMHTHTQVISFQMQNHKLKVLNRKHGGYTINFYNFIYKCISYTNIYSVSFLPLWYEIQSELLLLLSNWQR